MNVLGILGNKNAGKDTVGKMVTDSCNGKSIAFATPLKELAAVVFGFNADQLWGPSGERDKPDPRYDKSHPDLMRTWRIADNQFAAYAPYWLQRIGHSEAMPMLRAWLGTMKKLDYLTPRWVLQTLGTEFGRAVTPDVWVAYGLKDAADRLSRGAGIVVITDTRFLNEARTICEAGGAVWHIIRSSASLDTHASERDQADPEMKQYVTEVIYNVGSLQDLETLVGGAVGRLRSKWVLPLRTAQK